ncbi:MAG: FliI/YscN family ATPase [Oligoflexus sp.]
MPSNELKRFDPGKIKASFSRIKWSHHGRVIDIIGTMIEAALPNSKLGTIVKVDRGGHESEVIGEVVGFKKDRVLILPYNHLSGIAPGNAVYPLKTYTHVPVGHYLLGQIIDPFMNSLGEEALEVPSSVSHYDIDREPPNPLARKRINQALSLGVRSIDSLLTFGQGQRIAIMAGSGVGKSVLMGMIAKNSAADINVIALIGERGREVREFIEKDLGPEGLERSVIVAVTSDQSPLMRIRGAKVATSIAEYFSDQGKNVMLMVDSLTRVAMAQREIGNAIGEPPTTKGYTPSVFSLLPKLLERAGPQKNGQGSISGLYTVLVDGDDFNDPVADAVRSILDGHINLSRKLAAQGHFPAIEVETSASRVMYDIVSEEHWTLSQKAREMIAVFRDHIDLIQIGAYQPGTNPKLDEAVRIQSFLQNFLRQKIKETCTLESAVQGLVRALSGQTYHEAKIINEAELHEESA